MTCERPLRDIFTLLALIATGWAVLATSSPRQALRNGTYQIQSECVSPLLSETVAIDDDQVVSPAGLSYLDFGFPASTVVPGVDAVGSIDGVGRRCALTYGSEYTKKEWIFSCFDEGEFACNIYIRDPSP